MRQGKGISFKMFGLQTQKFCPRMGGEKLGYITVNTV